MSVQGLYVELAFADNWKEDDPTWTDLAAPDGPRLATGVTIERGRDSEFNHTGPGQGTLTMRDLDGSLDPTNTGSALGTLDPMRQARIRLRNPVTDTIHHLFRGFVTEILYDLELTARLGHATLELSDAFEPLAHLEMIPNTGGDPYFGDAVPDESTGDIYFAETTGEDQAAGRINQALDQAGWPEELRRIFTGNVQLQGQVYARHDQLLAVIADAADAEFPSVSNFFISKDGLASFRGRFARFTPETYQATDDLARDASTSICFWSCGDGITAAADSAVAVLAGLSFRRSATDIINASLVLPKDVDEADVPGILAKDDTSIDAYGWRSENYEDLLVLRGDVGPTTAVEECQKFASAIVANAKDPKTRISKLVFKGRSPDDSLATALWALICGVEIGDVIHVKTSHFDGAGGFDEDYFVEKISYTIAPLREGDNPWPDITLELDVSPRGFYSFNPYA